MGVVYLAEQTEPVERQVALKIIKPGMDTRQVIARFEAERQALAVMDHPHFDNDSHSDLWVVNGHTLEQVDDNRQLVPQRLQLFRQQPPKGFFEMAQQAYPGAATPIVGRGGAHEDYDGDGRVDLAIMAHAEGAILLHNISPDSGHWITLRLRQTKQNTHALGAKVTLRTGDFVQYAIVGTDASYLSHSSPDLHFGLGDAGTIDELTIDWPDGVRETHQDVVVDQRLLLTHDPVYSATTASQH